MQFTLRSLIALLAATTVTTAKPVTSKRDTTLPSRYYLQTKLVNPCNSTDEGTNKNNLWLYSYHTGAGLGDAALGANKTVAMEGYLNGTQQLFTYDGSPGPWPMAIGYGAYQEWNTVTISIAGENYYDSGFYFNGSGLQNNQSSGGWIACDWWHGVPQLFSIETFYSGVVLPKSCSKVELHPVAI